MSRSSFSLNLLAGYYFTDLQWLTFQLPFRPTRPSFMLHLVIFNMTEVDVNNAHVNVEHVIIIIYLFD